MIMITDDIRQRLNEAAIEVFGTMYFTPVELLPKVPPENQWHLQERYIKAVISYTGPQEAQLELYFPATLGSNISAGFLGVELDNLSEGQIVDTMREAANMIVGSLLGKLDPLGECKLGIPTAEMVKDYSPSKNTPEGSTTLAFISDFGLMWIFFK